MILEANGLVKKFGNFVAVNDVSFTMREGEVFGLLGPNGAGKSTTISMLTCLYPPNEGDMRIFGHDVVKDAAKVKKLIGVVPQDIALYPTLSARDNLSFFGEMYGLKGRDLKERVETVIDYVAMRERAKDAIKTYSGGMKRRINLAAGLVHGPKLLFLDEPTVGVDPQSRNHIFESVERLNKEQGMAILYTTHYMEEAERLCDRVGIIDRGKIIAMDTPKNLVGMLGGGIIQIGLEREDEELRKAVTSLSEVRSADFVPQEETEEGMSTKAMLKVEARTHANDALVQLIQLFNKKDVQILSLETLEPNLETVFLHLTGKSLRQ
ncbi:MAG: export ABC transporter ATP-binding protein [Anaerolineales bacterium]|nr:ATP-binding cassette domain-containing protein [Anaerolineae bacterium]PWB71877.1 MAG: export ABC transporter ATP-binding protein [Anaerolineales bacterium]